MDAQLPLKIDPQLEQVVRYHWYVQSHDGGEISQPTLEPIERDYESMVVEFGGSAQ